MCYGDLISSMLATFSGLQEALRFRAFFVFALRELSHVFAGII